MTEMPLGFFSALQSGISRQFVLALRTSSESDFPAFELVWKPGLRLVPQPGFFFCRIEKGSVQAIEGGKQIPGNDVAFSTRSCGNPLRRRIHSKAQGSLSISSGLNKSRGFAGQAVGPLKCKPAGDAQKPLISLK